MKFIDLFAGIGGFHLALSRLGMQCVFASEIDKFARKTYILNHKIQLEMFNDDIRNITAEQIPDHDILCAGFPCQPFSQAGHKRGFDDVHKSERGNLFYYIADILKTKRPKAFILENVRGLLNHNNGNTFNIIKNILEIELNYAISFKIIKASDFGSPQHRPRLFIVGFNNKTVNTSNNFKFPEPIPLTKSMSDIFEGKCTREIGLTLRVGGRGSPIDDRRNWDGYIVDGKEVRLHPLQGKRMMGYPDDFILPSSITQSMKQLGNSVCVDVVYHIAKTVKEYLEVNMLSEKHNLLNFNVGEWSELYSFLKMIKCPKVHFGSEEKLSLSDYTTILALQYNDQDIKYLISNDSISLLKNNKIEKTISIESILPKEKLDNILFNLKNKNKTTFSLNEEDLLNTLEVINFKGNSNQKQDIFIDHKFHQYCFENDPFSIKSFLGSNPTMLNASSNTNFIYKIECFNGNENIDKVNSIKTKKKIRDRINYIIDRGGKFIFEKCEKPIFQENLCLVDGDMPKILSNMLLTYYSSGESSLEKLITIDSEIIKIKRFLEIISMGMFPSKLWNGKYTANGIIIIKKDGDLLAYHMAKKDILNQYLFKNTKLDTPSSGRHSFGKIYNENNQLFFKLNLQIRNK